MKIKEIYFLNHIIYNQTCKEHICNTQKVIERKKKNMIAQDVMGELKDKRLLNVREICIYTGLGRTQARQFMDEIGATRKFGSRVLFDKTVIDAALDKMGE